MNTIIILFNERPKTMVPYLKVEKGDAGSHQAAHSDTQCSFLFFYIPFICHLLDQFSTRFYDKFLIYFLFVFFIIRKST